MADPSRTIRLGLFGFVLLVASLYQLVALVRATRRVGGVSICGIVVLGITAGWSAFCGAAMLAVAALGSNG